MKIKNFISPDKVVSGIFYEWAVKNMVIMVTK